MIMKYVTKDTEEISSYLGPFAVVGVFTFITASIFLGLFDTSVLALLTCLSIDMDCNGDSPAYGPPTFHDKREKIKNSTENGAFRLKRNNV